MLSRFAHLLPCRDALRQRAVAALLFTAGWLLLAQQHGLLWQRLAPSAVERFVADAVLVPLPSALPVTELGRLCARPLAPWDRLSGSRQRAAIARCLTDPSAAVDAATASAAAARYRAAVEAQIAAAGAWADAFDRDAPPLRTALADELLALQAEQPGWMARLDPTRQLGSADRRPVDPVRQAAGAGTFPPVEELRRRIAIAREGMATLVEQPPPAVEQARRLGLMAAGLELQNSHDSSPPRPYLVTRRGSLAEAVEWRRRGQAYVARGFTLRRLHALPDALFVGASALMAVVLATGAPAVPWALATLLLGAGAQLLTDLALTGDPAFRYLAERQFQVFGAGDHWLSLTLSVPGTAAHGGPPQLWWPWLGASLALLALRCLRNGGGAALRPLRGWVHASERAVPGALQAAALAAAGLFGVLASGLPAAVSEGLVALGCAGVATYIARQAPRANAGFGFDGGNLVIAAGALATAIGLAGWRGDLGHALVAAGLGACFFWLFGGTLLRGALAFGLLVAIGLLLAVLCRGQLPAPLQPLVDALPDHARQRIDGMVDPFIVDSSDLARVRWLIDSAGLDGWGPGRVPWQGFTASGTQAGLPLQGPSDYVLALSIAVWGQAGGLLLMGSVLCLFLLAARQAANTALRGGMPAAVRWLAAFGLCGCAVMAIKALLSLAGVAGLMPLTGLPVALLGYGPVGHLATLVYLCLALGLGHVQPAPAHLGVHVTPPRHGQGVLRGRAAVATGVAACGFIGLLAAAFWQLTGTGRPPDHHFAAARHAMAVAVAQALTPTHPPLHLPATTNWPCPQLADAAADWDGRLAGFALRLDAARLLAAKPAPDAASCRRLARMLGAMLRTDLPRIVAGVAGPGQDAGRLAAFEPPPRPLARRQDYRTANVWWGLPGCLQPAPGNAAGGCDDGAASFAMLSHDEWLRRELAPRLHSALQTPAGELAWNGHTVAAGPQLALGLDRRLQSISQQIADCYTARAAAASCAAWLPVDAAARRAAQAPGALRAGALGIVLVDVDSGRVAALADAISDCSLAALGRPADGPAGQPTPALREGARCAQWPDRRAAYLALRPPALWMVPPGSALKPLALVAGIDSSLVDPGDDARWTAVLAESHDQASVQRIALEAAPRYLAALADLGFGGDGAAGGIDLLWGGDVAAPPPLGIAWSADVRGGAAGLRASSLPFATMSRIRAEKEAGDDVDRRHGPAVMAEYVAARRLADASIGGADLRVSALGLADVWRRLDLRSRSEAEAPALHLLEWRRADRPVPRGNLGFGSPEAARRTLAMTRGITATAWRGSAADACRVVFGSCPPDGLPGLLGKTGTSDFLVHEGAADVKPGLQVPAKLFGGLFSHGGRRYAIGVMALRVPTGQPRRLELASSAAAEAALTLVRALRDDELPAASDAFAAPPSAPGAAKPSSATSSGAADHDPR